ncbi:MAG: TrkA family potassium uptake protein [Leptolyngbyaceae cyanobacterium SM2_5_2]|nr:TrkA family potassium uptake protein [Leptolyngbyaceae cyanobacterium SM2_5_2]
MNLSSLTFLRKMRSPNRQFAVIGLGRFGRAVCTTLHNLGYEVLAADTDERRVSEALTDQIAAHAVQLDTTQPSALKESGITEFDTVIVAIGNYVEESIITTLNLKEAGVKHVVAKASSEIHGKLLDRVGADHVVFPRARNRAANMARSLTSPGILDRFEIDPNHSIAEVIVPQAFDQKTIIDLDLRNRYNLTLLAISQDNQPDQFEINPSPVTRLKAGGLMVVIGSNQGLERLPM